MSQVREEYEKYDKEGGDEKHFTLESLKASASENGLGRTHPLVPDEASPCPGDGLVVASVVTGGPAFKHGIRLGDVIYSVDGKKIANLEEFEAAKDKPKSKAGSLKLVVAKYEPTKQSPQGWKRRPITVELASEPAVRMAPLKRTPDPITGDDLYAHQDEFSLTPPNVMGLAFFRKQKTKPKSMMLSIDYVGDSWIFANRLTVRADAEVFEFPLEEKQVHQNVLKGGNVRESIYFHFDKEDQKKMLAAVLSAKKVLVRMSGSKGLHDAEVPVATRANMLEVRKVYEKLGGD